VQIVTSDDPTPLTYGIGSFEFTTSGKMTQDHDWRINLKPGDMIDGYDRGKWYPSTVLSVKKEMVNGLPKIDTRIGFRVYIKFCENWADYRRIWPEKSIAKDSNGDEYFGDSENMDETLPHYTKRIMETMSYSTVKKNGYPDLGDYQMAYHVVREADLLSSYDFDRSVIYHMNKGNDLTNSYHNALKLFQDRVFNYNTDKLLLSDYAQQKSFGLTYKALKQMNSWNRILKKTKTI
jgi:hypothetical protein